MNNRSVLSQSFHPLRGRLTLSSAWAALIALVVLSSGCSTAKLQRPEGNTWIDKDLIYGVSILGATDSTTSPITQQIVAPEDVLDLTPEMRKFTQKLVYPGLAPMERARRLVRLLVRKDFFPKGYYTTDTRTASEVFEERSGNCLSYTNLFVAMAREVKLRANFQLARIPATWSSDSGYLVKSRHINVLISDPRVPFKDWITVDFNKVASSAIYPHTPVSDEFALSSYYNNIAIDKLYERDYVATFSYLARAIEVEPNNADAWVNLAAVYSQHNKTEEMRAAFEAALRAEPGNESALSGLAKLYRSQGALDKADYYKNEIRSRRERDPYFQFATAQAAYEQEFYEKSLLHIGRAIELKDHGAFYYLKALAHYARGELDLASQSLEDAQDRKRSLPSKKQEHALQLAQRINAQLASRNGLTEPKGP